jgi:hypothetical protein
MRMIHLGRAFLRLLLLLTFLFILVTCAYGREADQFLAAIEGIKHSVVPVVCGTEDGRGGFNIELIDGTGFMIDTVGHFLTAGHVAHDLMKFAANIIHPCVMAIYIPDSGWQRSAKEIHFHWFRFIDCQFDEAMDLAVCKTILLPPSVHPVAFEIAQPPDGSPIAFTGFPLGSIQPLSSRGNVATYRAVADDNGPRELVMDKGTWPGASGSPIYNAEGNILGIVLQRGTNEGVGMAIARPTSFILKFLDGKGIAVTQANPDKKKSKHKS